MQRPIEESERQHSLKLVRRIGYRLREERPQSGDHVVAAGAAASGRLLVLVGCSCPVCTMDWALLSLPASGLLWLLESKAESLSSCLPL